MVLNLWSFGAYDKFFIFGVEKIGLRSEMGQKVMEKRDGVGRERIEEVWVRLEFGYLCGLR